MARRQVKRVDISTTDLDREVADYLLARSTEERSSHQTAAYKARFMKLLEQAGEKQEGGHRILHLNEPVIFYSYKTGKAKEITVSGIRRVRREGTSLNEERAMQYLAKKNLLDQCTTQVTVLNEDAILALNFDETISDADLATLYDDSETFAFYLVEETK
jgi:hypothetical protein